MLNGLPTNPPVVCSRWYFTFDEEECQPPIDGVVFEGQRGNSHYPHQIGGFCQKTTADQDITKGMVNIEFRIGKCHHESRQEEGNPYLGLDSVSRVIITEMPPPQK